MIEFLETVATIIGVVLAIFVAGVIPMVGDHLKHRISEHFRFKRAISARKDLNG